MIRFSMLSTATLLAALALPATAEPGRVNITAEQVATAISGTGMNVSPDQVTLLTDVVARSSAPRLGVESIEPWGNHRMKVRMDCVNHEQCLPFYVSIRLKAEAATNAGGSQADQGSTEASLPDRDPKAFQVRAGSKATLLIDSGHVHIRLVVVCLENGAAGQKIRVECKDPHQTYIAQVMDGGVLRGSL
jgi:hypothetical protein